IIAFHCTWLKKDVAQLQGRRLTRLKEIVKDRTPCAVKDARTVWSGGKLSDYFKELSITIKIAI
ncbi:MAG: hypothetical protein IJK81_12300, partial [Selenomonadaceae bacterium]|nr:hypothetical protein [Selenomonadaceae bacterium]